MTHEQIVKAILFIYPDAEFVIRDGEIDWLSKEYQEPTMNEIEEAYSNYNIKKENEKLTSQKKKAEIIDKLGISTEEFELLLTNA